MRALTFFLAMGLAACGPPPPPCELCTPESESLRAIEGTSWLVARLTFEPAVDGAEGRSIAAGFDLDRTDTAPDMLDPPCDRRHVDYVSPLDAALVGVDNTGQELIGAGEDLLVDRTFQGELDRAAAEGRVRMAVRIGELTPEGFLPLELWVIDAGQTIAVDASGRPLANQSLAAHVVASAGGFVRGSLAWANLEATEPLVDGHVALLPFIDLRVGAFGIAALSIPDAIIGNLGGSFSVDALVATGLIDVPAAGEGAFRYIFSGFADFDVDPNTSVCRRISVGFGFEAVPLEIVGG